MRRNEDTEVIPFSDDVVKAKLNPRDSVMTNAQHLASLPSGGTACSKPLEFLNKWNRKGDVVVYVSDNQSWVDFGTSRSTVMAEEWEKFRARNPNAKIVLIDIQPYAHTQISERADVMNVGGFSDAVFDVVSLFAKGDLGSKSFVEAIKSVTL
jgi:60 kDa SS-A/Ro ribonucleoprotein